MEKKLFVQVKVQHLDSGLFIRKMLIFFERVGKYFFLKKYLYKILTVSSTLRGCLEMNVISEKNFMFKFGFENDRPGK